MVKKADLNNTRTLSAICARSGRGTGNGRRGQAPATLYERYKQPHAYALASPVRRSAPLRITRRKGQVTWAIV